MVDKGLGTLYNESSRSPFATVLEMTPTLPVLYSGLFVPACLLTV